MYEVVALGMAIMVAGLMCIAVGAILELQAYLLVGAFILVLGTVMVAIGGRTSEVRAIQDRDITRNEPWSEIQ